MTAIIATVANPECVRIIVRRQARRQTRKQAGNAPTPAIANFNNTPHRNKPMNRALTAARHLLAPLALAAMLLGLASNAAAQAPTGVTLSVNPATVTESAAATTITVTATVDGGTFAVERVVGFSTAGSGSGSTATQNDYTSVGFTPLTIPANMASASTTIEFTAAVDAVAEPAGETVVIEGILQLPNSQDSDTSIPVTSATITINDPAANIAPIYSSVIFGSLSYVQNRMISPTTLPAVTTPGNGDTVYSMAVLPAGLTFDAATRAIIGTPTVAVVQTSYTLTAHDSDDDNAASDSATFPVRITVQADLTPTFTGVDVPAQVFRAGQRVDVTLPAATGGDGTLTYTLTGPSAAALATALPGATFTASTRVLSGVLTGGAFAATAFIYTATDQDSDEATATLMITVEANKAPAYPEGTTFADQVFFPNQVVDLTLPGITPGTGDISITYTLTPALPDGLTFNAANSMRTITGTTTAAAVATTPYTLTVTDGDTNTEVGDTATLMFTITVEADTAPAFADGEMIDQQNFMQNVAITPVTLPAASGGNGALTYTLTAATPVAGLTLDPTTRVLSGTPTAATGTPLINMLVVMDADANEAADDGDTLNFLINVEADPRPSFTGVTVDDQNFFAGELIDVTLPAVSGGGGAITYTLTGPSAAALATALPGATLDSATRVLSGKLTGPAATARAFTYTATNADGADSTTFMVTIAANKLPLFPVGASIDDQFFLTTVPVALTLPGVISGSGDVSIHYAITPDLPAGLTFNAAASVRTITGTPTAVAAVTTHTLTVTDGDTNVPGDSDMLTFTITVEVDSAPAFADGTTIPEQRYTQGVMITPLTFPEATGGNAPLTYTLPRPDPLPPGLTFNADLRPPTLTGTTTLGEVRSGVLSRLTVTDNDGDSTFLPFVLHLEATDTVPTYAADVSIPDIVYVTGEVVDQTLPRPDGGNTPIVYSLTPALPPGLTFVIGLDPATITGTVGANAIASVDYTLTAADSDPTGGAGDEDTLMFSITVEEDTAPAFATNAEIPALASYPRGTAITPLTFPEATGGNGDLTYALTSTGAMPAGLTFNGDARPPTLTGTPAFAGSVIYSYTVTDADDNTVGTDSAVLTFTFVATASATTLNFPSSTHTLHYPLGAAITPTTFPTATAGTAPLTYAVVSGDMPPAGLTFDSTNRILSGTPSAAGSSSFTYRVTDSATPTPDNDLLETTIVICEDGGMADGGTTCTPPAFVTLVLPAVAEQAFQQILPITTPVTLPEATGGSGASPVRIYTLTPLPAGLAFDPATRAISGRPEAVGTTTVNYRVGDAGAGNADTQSTTVMFDIVVFGRPLLPAPGSVVYAVGDTVALTLTTGQRGTPPYTYALSTQGTGGALTLPAGLTFNGDPRPPTITGMPTAVTALLRYSYEVTDSRGVTNSSTFSITVNAAADIAPDFDTATVPDQFYTVGTAIPDLTLPEVATPGNGATTYILTAPPGLNFDPMTRVLSGTPTTAAGVTTYTYTARDEDESPDTLAILITVNAAAAATPSTQTLTLNPTAVTESATPTDITATITLNGGTYAVERLFSIGSSSGSATEGTDYTALSNVVLTIPANAGSGTVTFPFTATDDMVVEGGGEALTIHSTLQIVAGTDPDSSLPVANAVINISDPVAANTAPAFADGATVAAQTFTIGTAVDLTLPTATGGNPPISYTLLPAIPGLTLDAATGVLTGMPTTVAGATMHTYTAADGDSTGGSGDEDSLTFSVTVNAAAAAATRPTFFQVASSTFTDYDEGGTAVGGPTTFFAEAGTETVVLTLGGADAAFFSITQAGALSFSTPPDFEMPRGMAPSGSNTNTYRVTITATASPGGLTQDQGVTVHVVDVDEGPPADTAPTFGAVTISPQVFTIGTAVDLTLPAATGGEGAITYTLLPAIPGLTLDATTGALTGTPTTAAAAADHTYTAGDTDGSAAGTDEATLTIRITVNAAAAADTPPTFSVTSITAQTFTVGTAVDLTLPVATGGNAPYTYTLVQGLLAPPLPDGLTFNAVARTITGTPTTAAVAADYTYTAADADMNTAADDTVSLTISITVSEAAVVDSAPTFGSARIPAQVYTVDVPVNLTLPLPTSNIGEAPFTYDLLDSAGAVIPDLSTVIPGLTFTAAARTITGTPTGALVSTNFAYRVSDSDANMASSDTASLSFSITVNTVEADTAPTFFVDTFPELIFVVNQPITQVTLPSASGGNGDIVYGFSSPPVGLNFEPSTRVLSGTPTEVRVLTRYGYSVRDTDGNAAGTDADTLLLSITVTARTGNLVPAFADGASIAAQNYIAGSPITTLTLPVASGGDGTLVYSLRTTGANPTLITDLSTVIPGLTLDITARTITGTPTTASGAGMSYTWNAEDMDNDLASLVIDISVAVNAVPTFDADSQRIANQAYSVGQTVAVTLPPTATSGNGPTVYTLTPALPDGLTFTPAARTISGMPATETASAEYTYTARDSDSNTLPADEASLMFTVTVTGETAGTAPSFGTATDESRTYIAGLAIEPLTLPVATGGDGAITYTLTGPSNAALNTAVPGLTFDAATRTLSGTPTTVAVSTDLTYTAGDTDDSAPGTDEVTLTLSITIEAGTGTAPPTFGGATVSPQAYFVGTTITSLTLPVATGGTGAITYTLTPALPTGLIFNATARTITGTASAAAGATDYTYTATDGDMNTATLMFSITIDTMDTAPAFAGSASITAQTYMVNTAIMPLTLPAVTDGTGNGAITYTLSPAIPGLTLNPTSRVLTGTPTTVPTVTMYTYTAADSDDTTGAGDEVSLMFSITVIQAPPTAIRLSVNPAAVTESDDPTTITVTATLIGGSYSTAQTITVRSIDGTATSADYTPVSTPLTIPANATSGIATFMFTTVVDTVAEPGGETVLIMGLPVNGIMVSPATLTINDYDLVVNAGDDQTVASGGTITLNGEVTGSTDTTTAWALSDSAATRAALEAAGLTTAEATTEVGRLTTALAGTGPDRTFPAPAANLGLTDPVALAFTLTVTDNAPPGGQDAATAMDEVTITVEANTTAVTTTLNEAILPEVTRALVHSTSSSITRRVGQAVGSIPTVGSFNLAGQQMGGQDNLARALQTHGEAMSTDSRDIKEMLAGSEFVLPLNAGGAGIDPSSVAFWGSGEYRDFSGESDDLDWDGDLTGFQLGLDARLRNNLLVGVAVSMLETDVDYEDDTGILGQGDYELDLTSAHPYIGWRADELDLWATVGYGTGDLEITGQGETPQSGDVNLQTIGGGGSGMLWQDGTTTLRLKGEVSQTQLEVKGSDDFAKQEIDATGIRIAVEATRPRTLDGGGIFEPSVEVAARYDGGDGETGGGAEVGGALRYRNPATGLTADGRIRALMGQGGSYEEWGISGTVRVAPGTDGQGLSFSVSPGYGDSGSGIQELWRHGLTADDAATTDDYAMKLDARVGYGFGFILNEHHGILTPYSELTYGTTDSYRMGLNWAAGTRFDLTLLGERREPSTDPAEHAVLLKGEVRF